MAEQGGVRSLVDPDLVERLKEISDESKTLVQQEVQLAKAEILQKVDVIKDDVQQTAAQVNYQLQQTKGELVEVGKKAGIGAGLFSGAGLFGLAAFATLTAALVAGLAEFMPVWGSALVVTALYGIAAGILALAGKSKVQEATDQLPAATQHITYAKEAATSAKDRIQQDVPLAPQQTIESIKESKDQLADAWKRGSTETQPPWQSPGLKRK